MGIPNSFQIILMYYTFAFYLSWYNTRIHVYVVLPIRNFPSSAKNEVLRGRFTYLIHKSSDHYQARIMVILYSICIFERFTS